MFKIIIIMFKCTPRVIWRINVYTFNLPCEILFEGAKREQIVAVNEHIARPRFTIGESVGFDLPITIFRGVKEQTRLNGKRLIVFAYPRQFQLIYIVLCHYSSPLSLRK